MLNYSLGARSRRHIQIVDTTLEDVYARLVGEETKLKIAFLREPEDLLPEEKTEDFLEVLEHAKVSDTDYLTTLDTLEREGRDDEIELAKLERQLRDRVRAQLGLPPRPARTDISRTEHVRWLDIDPGLELPQKSAKQVRENHYLQTLKYPDELERVIDKIASQARLAEQEMGVSTLFLAFGFLEWYESDDAGKQAYAPLLLLPVSLDSEKVRGGEVYYLSAREGGAEANLSLQKLLEQDYKRHLEAMAYPQLAGAWPFCLRPVRHVRGLSLMPDSLPGLTSILPPLDIGRRFYSVTRCSCRLVSSWIFRRSHRTARRAISGRSGDR